MQQLALTPHRTRVNRFLHVPPVTVRALSGFSHSLPTAQRHPCQVNWWVQIGCGCDAEHDQLCLSLCLSCATCPGCNSPLGIWQLGSSQPATLNWIIGWWRMDELALMLCFLRYHGAYSIFIQNIFPVEMHYVQTRVYLTINVHVHKNLIYFITVSQTF